MLGDAERSCILRFFLFRQYFSTTTSISASAKTAAATAAMCFVNMVDQDEGELAEGDPEEAGGIGDARVVVASSSIVVLVAAVGHGQEPRLGA